MDKVKVTKPKGMSPEQKEIWLMGVRAKHFKEQMEEQDNQSEKEDIQCSNILSKLGIPAFELVDGVMDISTPKYLRGSKRRHEYLALLGTALLKFASSDDIEVTKIMSDYFLFRVRGISGEFQFEWLSQLREEI